MDGQEGGGVASTELRLWDEGVAGDLAVPGGELVLESSPNWPGTPERVASRKLG
jgi:hypothetical protein